jgi:hypothetical protein
LQAAKHHPNASFHHLVGQRKQGRRHVKAEQNPSFVAIQSYVADSQDRTSYIDDAMARDCMKAKGYIIQGTNE